MFVFYFSFFFFHPGTNHSFLVYQESNNVCLSLLTPHSSPIYVVASTCDPTSYKQRWIWTQNKQLLNEYSLKCLERSNEYLLPNGNRYPLLVLNFCNATNARQLWQCQGKKKNLFFLRYDKRFLRFRYMSNLYVYLFRRGGKYSSWRRYGRSDQSLCSQISSYNGEHKSIKIVILLVYLRAFFGFALRWFELLCFPCFGYGFLCFGILCLSLLSSLLSFLSFFLSFFLSSFYLFVYLFVYLFITSFLSSLLSAFSRLHSFLLNCFLSPFHTFLLPWFLIFIIITNLLIYTWSLLGFLLLNKVLVQSFTLHRPSPSS